MYSNLFLPTTQLFPYRRYMPMPWNEYDLYDKDILFYFKLFDIIF